MELRVAVLLCSVIGLAAGQTTLYAIPTDCGTYSQPAGAISYNGTLSTSVGESSATCTYSFRLLPTQRKFLVRVDLVTQRTVTIKVTQRPAEQHHGGGGHGSSGDTSLWEKTFTSSVRGYTEELWSTSDYVQTLTVKLQSSSSSESFADLQVLVTPKSASCPSNDTFVCSPYDTCIQSQLACDGFAHCRDESDERFCQMPTVSATTNRNNGTVVLVIWWWSYWYYQTAVFVGAVFLLLLVVGLFACCVSCCCGKKKHSNRVSHSHSHHDEHARAVEMVPVHVATATPLTTVRVENHVTEKYGLPPAYDEVVIVPVAALAVASNSQCSEEHI